MSRAIQFYNAESNSGFDRPPEPAVKLIGIVLYDGFSLTGIGTLIEALQIANELQHARGVRRLTYSICLVSARGGTVACSSSVCMWTERLDGQRSRSFDALYVAGGTDVTRASADHALLEPLKLAWAQKAAISALGNGHAVLTAAGLSGNSWASAERGILGHNYLDRPPSEQSDALFYSLDLVKRDLGCDIASSVAERLASDNDQHVSVVLGGLGTPTVAEKAQESARWLERNCGNPVSVFDAARTAAMSERNFLRHFKREIGLTPSQYLLRARLKLSCELLANSELPIDKIARRTGLSNGERLSKLFRKQFSMSPTEYRAGTRRKLNLSS
ncbi:AraC family transcriptional regulator [Caballeronia megalochromosomata]|jgi:transcriptional regulator GlxA family with amidase domain|nr:AraC family transcriptional regulator [Caballeronia megalochromosomata]